MKRLLQFIKRGNALPALDLNKGEIRAAKALKKMRSKEFQRFLKETKTIEKKLRKLNNQLQEYYRKLAHSVQKDRGLHKQLDLYNKLLQKKKSKIYFQLKEEHKGITAEEQAYPHRQYRIKKSRTYDMTTVAAKACLLCQRQLRVIALLRRRITQEITFDEKEIELLTQGRKTWYGVKKPSILEQEKEFIETYEAYKKEYKRHREKFLEEIRKKHLDEERARQMFDEEYSLAAHTFDRAEKMILAEEKKVSVEKHMIHKREVLFKAALRQTTKLAKSVSAQWKAFSEKPPAIEKTRAAFEVELREYFLLKKELADLLG